jgi:hypothetical protein
MPTRQREPGLLDLFNQLQPAQHPFLRIWEVQNRAVAEQLHNSPAVLVREHHPIRPWWSDEQPTTRFSGPDVETHEAAPTHG